MDSMYFLPCIYNHLYLMLHAAPAMVEGQHYQVLQDQHVKGDTQRDPPDLPSPPQQEPIPTPQQISSDDLRYVFAVQGPHISY